MSEWIPKCAENHLNSQIEALYVYNKLSETHMQNQLNSHGCYHFFQSDIKKLVLDLWGNEMYFAPIAMKFEPMATNYHLMNIKLIILFNYIQFIHKSSIFYIFIQIYQYYKSLQQGG